MARVGFAACLLAVGLSVVAGCRADERQPASRPAVEQTSTATPTAISAPPTEFESKSTQPSAMAAEIPPPLTAWPAGTRTGNAFVDKVITLVDEKDWTGLADLALWTSVPCEAPRPVQPQPLLCRDEMSPGEPLTGFWMLDVEGGLWPPDRARLAAAFGSALPSAQLHGVYTYAPGGQDAGQLPAPPVHDLVFVTKDAMGWPVYPNFDLSDRGLLRFDFRFSLVPAGAWDSGAGDRWLLPRAP
jgi:hypothetical protein